MAYQPIQNYGMIGDLNTVALIGLNGSIDFMCFPDFDSPTIFAANPNIIFMADYHYYQACIDACLHCASICNHCAASCTQEKDVKMIARCIQLDMKCAAICH
jgi:GH15 family glucan-1,4-alpha-glucosidase